VKQQHLDVLCINESRLSPLISSSMVHIEGYELHRFDRNRYGGGVCLYIKLGIIGKNRCDLTDGNIECLVQEIRKPNSKPFAIITCYRPPDYDVHSFLKSLENMLTKIDTEFNEYYILGDLNCDLLSPNNPQARRLENLAELFQLTQLINEPTRITEKTRTLIDVILTNTPTRVVQSGVIHIGISDHSLVYTIRKIGISTTRNSHNMISYRSKKHFNIDKFINDLNSVPWENLDNLENPDDMWNTWKKSFLSVLDSHAPIKRKRIRNKTSPWMTIDLRKAITNRDNLKKKAIRTDSTRDWMNFRAAKNRVNNDIKKTKKDYYHQHFDQNTDSSKEIWKTINEILSRESCQNPYIKSIKVSNKTFSDSKEIAETFNAHFAEIGTKLAGNIPDGPNTFADYLTQSSCSFTLQHTSTEEITKIINSMDTTKATGLDGIPPYFIKTACPVICQSLVNIFNRSIDAGIFPSDLKLAKVTPIHKANCKDDVNNYRPISVLPSVAKIFERIVFNQLYDYLNKNGLLSSSQSGFRPTYSTATALLEATTEWLTNMDEGMLNCVTFLDLAKAFDTVNHSILLKKLSYYGIADQSIKWFESYLVDRSQKCYVNNTLSNSTTLQTGIPQGSIIGPLLFIIYINDLPNSVQYSNARMYADDTSLSTSAPSQNELFDKVNTDVAKIENWLMANKLSLNSTKTEHMFIASDDNLRKITSTPHIYLGKNPVKRVYSAKSLGVIIDDRMSWSAHIEYVCKKISSGLSGIRQARDYITQDTAQTIYNALVLSWFDYCDVVWDNLPITLADRLQKLQNRAARIITKSNYDIRSRDILASLGWKSLAKRRQEHKAITMFKALNGLAPENLSKLFQPQKHKYNFREKEKSLTLPKPKTNFMKRAFVYDGAKIWNSLPSNVKCSSDLYKFKRSLLSTGSL